MRKLLVLALLVGLLLVGDVVARSAAESAVASGVRSKVQGVGAVDAHIDSFPFTPRLLGQGRVQDLDLRLHDVVGHGIDVARLRLDATGIDLDRSLLYGGKVRIRAVERVAVTAEITEAAVRAATHADVRLLDGRAEITVAGLRAEAAVSVVGGRIQLRVGSLPALRVPVPDADLLPCAVDARVVPGAIVASCTSDHLPPIVLRAIGTVDVRQG